MPGFVHLALVAIYDARLNEANCFVLSRFEKPGGIWHFAEFGSWNGHAIKILRPVRRIVRRAIVPPGPREKGHLRDLGVTGGRRDYLDSDDLLLFARCVGHTLPKLLNSGFRAACLQKKHSSDLPIAGWLRRSFFTWPRLVQNKTSALILGSSSRPVRPMADWNHELGYWLRGALKLWIQHNRGARQIRTPNLGIC